MPKYSFKCKNCETEFSVNVPYEEKWNSVCPKCGSSDKREVFKPVGHSIANTICERLGLRIPPPGRMPK